MKRFAGLLVAGLFLVPLSACSGQADKPAATVTVTATPTPTPSASDTVDSDESYADAIRGNISFLSPATTKDIVRLGNSTCRALDHGVSINKLANIFMDTDPSAEDAGYFIGASVAYLCPEHDDEVQNFINMNSINS